MNIGQIRVSGTGHGFLTGADVQVEIMQEDGMIMRLPGVLSVDVRIRQSEAVTATMVVLVGELDLEGVFPQVIRPVWWRRAFWSIRSDCRAWKRRNLGK